MTLRSTELESLEAQIREMENRLKQSKGQESTPTQDSKSALSTDKTATPSLQKGESADKAKSRPGSSMTARPAPSSGDMPPTPVASEGEYEVVDRAELQDDESARPRA